MNKCVFCDYSKIAANTLATIRGFHITATLGQITEGGYLLLLPMDHVSCIGAFDTDRIESFEKITTRVKQAIAYEYNQDITVFEHGIVGQTVPHAHLHLLPARVNMTKRIVTDFRQSTVEKLESFEHLTQLYSMRGRPYLFWSTPGGSSYICWDPPAPKMYLRLIIAELLGVPERGDWKSVDPVLDSELRTETLARLTPYFLP